MARETKEEKKIRVEREAAEAKTLANAIRDISASMEKLVSTGLNEKAVAILLKHETRLSMRVIEDVFYGLKELERKYCVQAKKKTST